MKTENMYEKGFKAYLQLEMALSENTVAAYLHDVNLLFSFLSEKKPSLVVKKIQLGDLQEFLQFINKTGLASYSQSRVVSGIKSFFSYLMQKINCVWMQGFGFFVDE